MQKNRSIHASWSPFGAPIEVRMHRLPLWFKGTDSRARNQLHRFPTEQFMRGACREVLFEFFYQWLLILLLLPYYYFCLIIWVFILFSEDVVTFLFTSLTNIVTKNFIENWGHTFHPCFVQPHQQHSFPSLDILVHILPNSPHWTLKPLSPMFSSETLDSFQ